MFVNPVHHSTIHKEKKKIQQDVITYQNQIISMNNSNDTIGNRTRDLPAFNAVPQPNVPPRAPF